MRETLAILGGILAVLALTMAVVVFRKNFGGEDDTSVILRSIAAVEAKVEQQDKQYNELKERSTSLNRAVTDLEEKMAADPRKIAVTAVNEEVNKLINAAVQAEMNKRLEQVQTGGGSQQSDVNKAYEAMSASLQLALSVKGQEAKRAAAALERTRTELAYFYSEKRAGALPDEEFEKKSSASRTEFDRALKAIVGDDKFKAFEDWKTKLTDEYSKRFFGLIKL